MDTPAFEVKTADDTLTALCVPSGHPISAISDRALHEAEADHLEYESTRTMITPSPE